MPKQKSGVKPSDEWGFFVAIPELAIELIPRIGPDAFVLFCFLRYKTNRQRGEAWPTYTEISAATKMGRNRVSKAIALLEGADLLTVEKQFGKAQRYFLHPPPVVSHSSTASVLMDGHSSTDAVPSVVHMSNYCIKGTLKTQDSVTQDSKETEEAPRPNPRPPDLLFDAIAEICQVDPKTAGSSIGKVRAVLDKGGYTPEEVRAFGTWWWSDKFRRDRKTPPRVWQLQEQIGVVRAEKELGRQRYVEGPYADFVEH